VLSRSEWGQDVPKRLSPSAILLGQTSTRSPPKVSSAHLPAPYQDLQQQHKNLLPIAPVAMTPGPGVRRKGASTAGSRHRRSILRSTDPSNPDSTTALAIAVSLPDLTHWLCDGGRLNPAPHNNSAGYGACVATSYDRLEVQGMPTRQAPGYAGVPLELVVLKLDQYGQTMAADSSSSLQIYSALADKVNGKWVNDDSVSFNGAIFSVFGRGRAPFFIGVKPTFSSVSATDEFTELQRLPFFYISGTDMATGATMETEPQQLYLAARNQSVCPLGSVLTLASGGVDGRPGECTVCPQGSYSLNPLIAPPGATDPGCLACPVGGDCSGGAAVA
jgi:hypothetical protein